MKGTSPKAHPVWNKLLLLGQQQGSIKLKDLSHNLGLSEDETLTLLKQVFPNGEGAETYLQDNECWVDMNASAIQYMLPLSPTEWMELHNVLKVHRATNSIQHSLKKKLIENGPIKVMMELLSELELWDQKLNSEEEQKISFIDVMIADKKHLTVHAFDGKTYKAYPWRLLHLEGELSLIAEDAHDHCLMVIGLKEIKELKAGEGSYSPQVTPFEVEDFINAIRAMNEKETRLILKIHDPQSVNLFPDHHFLGKPCMITNPVGDLIWAAYVEPCEPLYDWLMSLGNKVEILDPVKFKQDYLSYCEEKFRKIA